MMIGLFFQARFAGHRCKQVWQCCSFFQETAGHEFEAAFLQYDIFEWIRGRSLVLEPHVIAVARTVLAGHVAAKVKASEDLEVERSKLAAGWHGASQCHHKQPGCCANQWKQY